MFGRHPVVSGLAAVVAAIVCLSVPVRGVQTADRIWFCPGPGTIDFLRLFQHPEEWPRARSLVDVFKFYQGHTQTPAPQTFLPNSFEALAGAGVFRTLMQWNKKIAIEAGAVKEFYCTADASGMQEAIGNTLDSIRAVESAGGTVSYIAMDEPFVSGRSAVCGGPALAPTADRVAIYVKSVTASAAGTKVGLIEAYPFSSEAALENILDLLSSRGVAPAFLHVDVDSRALKPGRDDFTRDMRALRQASAARGVPFGIIVWGYNGDSDVLYAMDAEHVVNEISKAFTSWDDMPDQFVVQSWAVSSTGLLITPANLPETRSYTHTNLVWDVYRRFRAATGAPTSTAVPRR
jgi:hypothetical protein